LIREILLEFRGFVDPIFSNMLEHITEDTDILLLVFQDLSLELSKAPFFLLVISKGK